LPRVVAINTPIPIITMAPTTIHMVGTLSRYAAIASPTIRMMKPMRYVAKEDMPGRTAIMVRALLRRACQPHDG
jgi:hypothetical protein